MSQLLVTFACDTEDNNPTYFPGWQDVGSNYDLNPSVLKWEWTKYLHDLSELFKNKKVSVTWLIRVDNGPVGDHMLNLLKSEILDLESNGDEIGIHIHTFAWNQKLSKWTQTKNPKHETQIVYDSVAMFKRKLGFNPLSVRMGWYAMSNSIMKALEENGLLVDSSAIPGTFCSGKFGKRDNIYDWSRTPHFPYHPSYNDYQRLGNMKILEMPVSTLTESSRNTFAGLVNRLSGIKGLAKLLPIAQRLNLTPHNDFYFSPWWSPSAHSRIIKKYCKRAHANGVSFLVGAFHACDILDPKTGNKNDVFERQLSKAIETISSLNGIDVIFTTLSEMAKRYNSSEL